MTAFLVSDHYRVNKTPPRPMPSALRKTEPLSASRSNLPAALLLEALMPALSRGVDIAAVLAAAGLERDALTAPKATVTPAQFGRVWSAAARRLNDEMLCLDHRAIPCGSFSLLCHAIVHAPSLDRAVCRMLSFFRVLLPGFHGRLTVSGHVAEIEFGEANPTASAIAQAMFPVVVMGVARWLVGQNIPLHSAELCAEPVAEQGAFRRLLCDDLQFGRPRSLVRFDADFLALRPRRTERDLERFLADAPATLLDTYRGCDSLSAMIRKKLRESSPERWPSFEALAVILNTTASTLRRRLEDENLSYQKIKDGIRREQAIGQLRSSGKSNAEIANELGFEDPSTFYRAFKKWTGVTPNAFRGTAA